MKRFIIESDTERDDTSDARLYWNNRDGWTAREHATRFTIEERAEREMPIGGSRWVDICPEVGKPMRCPLCAGRGYYSGTDRGKPRIRNCLRCRGLGEVIRTRPIRFYLVDISRAITYYWHDRAPFRGWGDKRGATRFTNEQRAKLEADAVKLGTTVGGIWQECG